MAGAALVQSVCATTPADTHRLARLPRTMGARVGPTWQTPDESSVSAIAIALVSRECSELRSAIDPHRVAGDPTCVVGGEEGDHATDVVRLGEALQSLHAERE